MNILFLSKFYLPHVGGVETHTSKIAERLNKNGNNVTVLTEKYDKRLKNKEKIKGVNVVRFTYPHTKITGLLNIWKWIYKNKNIIESADIIHIHDVFIWYLPFRFLFATKLVITTFHGWEGGYPIPLKNIIYKKIAWILSSKTVAIGKYIGKYYGVSPDKIFYGATDKVTKKFKKIKNKVIFVGRLDSDTGVEKFLKRLDEHNSWDVEFVGDGPLRKTCEKYGKVHGFTDPVPFYKKAECTVPAGYLSYIEAKSYGCKIITYPNNTLKKDYWKEIAKVKKFPTWDELTNEYISLYNNI